MRVVAIFALAMFGCVTPAGSFECATSADCSGGFCEADGLCSFADAACPGGRRYGDSSGSKAGQCVDGAGACGDGMVSDTEECDDGNDVATDFCNACKLATCGDGEVLAGVEECDDSNTADGDACNGNCLVCPAGSVTNPANGHCYWVVETARDWFTAAADCTATKGYMVSIDDAAENTFVIGLLVNAQYWIGLEEIGGPPPRDFRWEDDRRLGNGFDSWAVTEPSPGMDDECVGMAIAGTWDAQLCGTVLPYVCEREPPTIQPSTNRVFHRFPGEQQRTYAEASAVCASLDPPGHLVTIADQAEQDFVDSLMDSSRFWIGLDDLATEGTFVWVTGEPTGFFNWNPNGFNGPEPDPVNSAFEDMAVMREDGSWETQDPTDDESFICEVEPG